MYVMLVEATVFSFFRCHASAAHRASVNQARLLDPTVQMRKGSSKGRSMICQGHATGKWDCLINACGKDNY